MGGQPSILAPRLLSNTFSLSSYIDILDSINFEKVIQDSRFLKSIQCASDNDGGERILIKLLIKPDSVFYNNNNTNTLGNNILNLGASSLHGNGSGSKGAASNLTSNLETIDGRLSNDQKNIATDNQLCNNKTDNIAGVNLIAYNNQLELKTVVKILDKQRSLLTDVPGVIPFTKIIETERAGYLIRQYLHNNLYDRLSTRPFLESIEKLWLVFQLLTILDNCHSLGITHGDIKTENILMTTWNSVYLTDFAPYKPIYLPEDNPGEFFFYFDTSQRRNCYLAPERFFLKNVNSPVQLATTQSSTEKMDIFSLGCVIAELYLEGGSIFTLSQLFKYKNNTYDPNLDNISDPKMKELVKSMIDLDPAKRKTPREYLEQYRGGLFPESFYNFLGNYMNELTYIEANSEQKNGPAQYSEEGAPILKNCDLRIEKIYKDYDIICGELGIKYDGDFPRFGKGELDDVALFPLAFNLPGIPENYTLKPLKHITFRDESVLILLGFVISSLRNTYVASSRIKGIELLVALSERIHDEGKLDRVVPFLVSLLDDECPEVRITSLKAATQVISTVDVITPINALIFPEYIIPKLRSYLTKDYCSSYEKMFFAAVLPNIALNIIRFYDMGQILKSNSLETLSAYESDLEIETPIKMAINGYQEAAGASGGPVSSDISRNSLIELIELFTLIVLTADENTKISFLSNIHVLCSVIGKEKTNDIVLSHLITYLNDKSSYLRLAFVKSIIGISVYVGTISLEQYILPLLVQSLSDPEEFIVIQVLQSFTQLVKLDLVKKHYIWDLSKAISKLILHPNEWIRQSALIFIINVSNKLSLADVFCTLYPIIRVYLEYDVTEFNWDSLYPCAKKPVSRSVYNLSFTWYRRAINSAFWDQAKGHSSIGGAVDDNSVYPSSLSITKSITGMISKVTARDRRRASSPSDKSSSGSPNKNSAFGGVSVQLTNEDKTWIRKLRASGLQENDLWKIYALKDHISKAARSQSMKDQSEEVITEIQKLGVFPRNVFLDIVFKPSGNFPNKVETDRQNKIINLTEKVRLDNESVFSGMSLQNVDSDNTNNASPVVPTVSEDTGLLLVALKKATPSLLTNQENIYGELDSISQNLLTSSLDIGETKNPSAIENDALAGSVAPVITHSYTGNNENILKYLKNYTFTTTLDNFYEFGPPITLPVEDKMVNINNSNYWPPKGTLVAHLSEHEGAINCLATSPDYSYFLSGSEDGYLKLWDSLRLERNVTSKSALSVNLKSSVRSICFIENRDCFAVSTKASIKIYRVSFSKTAKENYRIKKLVQIRSYKFDQLEGEFATSMEFVIVESKPLLIVISSLSQVTAIDVRTMKVEFQFQIPLTYGVTTSFCVDTKGTWILVGTSKGYLTLWDLRFRLNLKNWKFPGGKPIKKLSNAFNTYKHSFFTLMSDNNTLSIYDLSKGKIQEVYTIRRQQQPTQQHSRSDEQPQRQQRSSGLQRQNSYSIDCCVPAELPDDNIDFEYDDDNLLSIKNTDFSFDELEETLNLEKLGNQNETELDGPSNNDELLYLSSFAELKVPTGSHKKQLYLFTSNKTNFDIMFWDIFHPQNSKAVSNKYGVKGKSDSKKKKHRSTLISSEQKEAIRNHNDVITDMVLLSKPYFMIVSGDRSGIINVYR